jgi:hypothetical protein
MKRPGDGANSTTGVIVQAVIAKQEHAAGDKAQVSDSWSGSNAEFLPTLLCHQANRQVTGIGEVHLNLLCHSIETISANLTFRTRYSGLSVLALEPERKTDSSRSSRGYLICPFDSRPSCSTFPEVFRSVIASRKTVGFPHSANCGFGVGPFVGFTTRRSLIQTRLIQRANRRGSLEQGLGFSRPSSRATAETQSPQPVHRTAL